MLYVQGAVWGRGKKPLNPVPKGSLKMKISRINKKILHGRNGII